MQEGKLAEAKQLNVCPVHTGIETVKSRPGLCPVCRYKVDIPLENHKRHNLDMDADLCPHPRGGEIKFYARIPLCPRCGFAAYTEHFEKPLAPDLRAWVHEHLTPNVRQAQRQLFGLRLEKLQMTDADLVGLFNQETLPDVVRCENALEFYAHIQAHPSWRIRLATQCAWAYRREVCGPLHSASQMSSVRRVLNALERAGGMQQDMQERIVTLAGFYDEKQRFTYFDRQVIRLVLAGYYDRMGLTGWARTCLQQIEQSASRNCAADTDPWLEGTQGSMNDRVTEAGRRKAEMIITAQTRLQQLEREMNYLDLSVQQTREALQQGVWQQSPDKISSFVYLVGEHERRLERFTRAKLWLENAKRTIVAASSGPELYAPHQVAVMEDYMQRLGLKAYQNDPQTSADTAMLSGLLRTVQLARATTTPAPAPQPPMTLREGETPGTASPNDPSGSPVRRNEVQGLP